MNTFNFLMHSHTGEIRRKITHTDKYTNTNDFEISGSTY